MEERAEKTWRITLSLTEEQEEAILRIRQMDEFRRCSLSEVMRRLLDAGLKASGYFPAESGDREAG